MDGQEVYLGLNGDKVNAGVAAIHSACMIVGSGTIPSICVLVGTNVVSYMFF